MSTFAEILDALDLSEDADEETVRRAAVALKADADRALALEEELLAEYDSEQADGLDPVSTTLHLAALSDLRARGVEAPTANDYVRALETAGPSKPEDYGDDARFGGLAEADVNEAALRALEAQGIAEPTEEQYAAAAAAAYDAKMAEYVDALRAERDATEAAILRGPVPKLTTEPLPDVGKTRTRSDGTPPERKTEVDGERPRRGGKPWTDGDEYQLHRRALELDPGALSDTDRYAKALMEAEREMKEAQR